VTGSASRDARPPDVPAPAGVAAAPRHPLGFAVKRLVDLIGGLFLVVLLSPVLLMIALAILLESGRPVFYVGWRAGRDGVPFRPFKFRTILTDAETRRADFYLGHDDPRITPSGRFLRRWSLDELPQLFNVVGGSMSLVGPRPTLLEQVAKYDAAGWRRLLMKPGLTGWAQINGRNAIDWERRIVLDAWYVDNWSLPLDVKCLFGTFAAVA
jgi:lipopolysaccharide/colanic/teichoic acid biosynthesis glycosyltransferase